MLNLYYGTKLIIYDLQNYVHMSEELQVSVCVCVEECEIGKNPKLCWTVKKDKTQAVRNSLAGKLYGLYYSFLQEVSIKGKNPIVYRAIGFIYL